MESRGYVACLEEEEVSMFIHFFDSHACWSINPALQDQLVMYTSAASDMFTWNIDVL
jgi:hypothetical protein